MKKQLIVAVLLTWIVVSMVPAIQITSLLGKGKKRG